MCPRARGARRSPCGSRHARHGGARFNVSASFGIAVADAAGGGPEFDRLMARADEAAYVSKLGGRNRVSVWRAAASAPARAPIA